MNQAVWKFDVQPTQYPIAVEMPKGARILTMAEQHGTLRVWALVDPMAPGSFRQLWVIGTGWACDVSDFEWRATCLASGGAFVWHLFERASAPPEDAGGGA